MAVRYVCRYCRTPVGEISEQVSEFRLGFHSLTPEERNDIITYNSNGDVTVKLVCDYCNEALRNHPELSLISNPLQ